MPMKNSSRMAKYRTTTKCQKNVKMNEKDWKYVSVIFNFANNFFLIIY